MTVTFDQFAANLTYTDIPQDVLAILRRSFTDTMGVAAVGSTTSMSGLARKAALAVFGTGTAGSSRMLMDGRSVSPAGAAMAGAFLVDSIDAHDGVTPCQGHAGSAVFPALIAMAQSRGKPMSGAEFATYLAVAYEVCYRAGETQHATCEDYHTSGAWTSVGIATSGARMLNCDPEAIRHAAGIGEYHGPRSQMMRCIDFPTNVRDGVGWGAPSGVTAAYLASEGFTGAPALTCEGAGSETFWQDLGQGWRITDYTHYKAYPCCRWSHAAIDSVSYLIAEHGLTHDMIKSVEIRTFHYATRLAGQEPANLDEFTYAIAFPVAAMIVRGQVGVAELTPEALRDPDILRISRATKLIDDDHFTEISRHKRWAQVTLVLKGGRRIEDIPRTPRGDADLPLSDAEISSKFHLLADPVLGSSRANEIEQLSGQFDKLSATDLQRLFTLCTDAT
ncbi:2-methylcitrate dehydratase PrpD [Shimia gijangensis]|uniref:2-methylcitrate dehydratase PrpD n=1 Tax=Shimia gijangensis TaxID=1470563 RepID=A0A1M6PTE6_9RHOB|nr:MmgE/PrpD family protein [Shimia gijangensis]SHK11178.1 2-methylcitrate dehydratase PrpD [Shimia gijangensis]